MKVMNVVFGIAIALAIFVLVLTSINVFYPGPDWRDNNCTEPKPVEIQICNPDMTVGDCYTVVAGKQINDSQANAQKKFDDCNKEFQDRMDKYDGNMLIVNYIIGLIVIIVGLFLIIYIPSMVNLATGADFAGLALIFYGFIRGWMSTSDKIKFVLAVIITAVIVVFAIIVNKRYQKKQIK